MEGTATPWTYTGNLLNKGNGSMDDTVDGYLPWSICQQRQPSHLFSFSLLETFYKHRPKLQFVWLTVSLLLNVPGAPVHLFFFFFNCWSREVSLPSFMLQAHELSRQPRSELSLKEFLLLFGSGPGCLHSAAGEAPYCLDKLPNTQPGGCPITHPPRCVSAITSLYILRLT